MLVWLPSEGQRSVWVKVDVVDSFTVTLLVQDLLPELQVPQTPRVVIATGERERESVLGRKPWVRVICTGFLQASTSSIERPF